MIHQLFETRLGRFLVYCYTARTELWFRLFCAEASCSLENENTHALLGGSSRVMSGGERGSDWREIIIGDIQHAKKDIFTSRV